MLIFKLDLGMVKMYLDTQNKLPSFSGEKLQPEQTDTHRQIDQGNIITYSHTQVIVKVLARNSCLWMKTNVTMDVQCGKPCG